MTLKELLVALDGDYEVAVYNTDKDEKGKGYLVTLTPMNVFKYEDRVVNSFKIWKPDDLNKLRINVVIEPKVEFNIKKYYPESTLDEEIIDRVLNED